MEILEKSEFKLSIYNLRGQLVEIIADEEFQSGRYSYTWHAENYPSGIYIVNLATESFKESQKLVLIK